MIGVRGGPFGSTIFRLTLMLVVAQICALALGLTMIHRFTSAALLSDARTAAEVARADLMEDYQQIGLSGLIQAINYRLKTPEDRNFVVLLKAADGQLVVGNLQQWPQPLPDHAHWRQMQLQRTNATIAEPMGVVSTRLPHGYALLTGEILESHGQLTRVSETAALYALIAGLIISTLMASFVAKILARRIDVFSRAAQAFVGGNLDKRVERDETGDAFDRLALHINAMFGRIAALVKELRMVTDSMAHDLRSPVARLQARLEQALGKTQDIEAQIAIARAIEEADNLHRLLDTALEMSRAEAGIGRDQFTTVALGPLLDNLAEVYGPLAEDHGFMITIDMASGSELEIFGHRDLLIRAVSNLIDNSLKYAVGGSHIRIGAQKTKDDHIELIVADDGPGLNESQRAEAMKRFVRLDPARGGNGAGLGLAFVETVAHLHNGSMQLAGASPQGLAVTLILR